MQKYYQLESIRDVELDGKILKKDSVILGRWSKNCTKFLMQMGNNWVHIFESPFLGEGYGFKTKLQDLGFDVINKVYYKGYQPVGDEIIPVKTGGLRIRIPMPNAQISHSCDQVNFGNKKWYTMLSKSEKCPVCYFQYEEDRYCI